MARAAVETALRGAWPDARVLVFGSARLGTAHAASDVDLCAVLPSVAAHAHPRSKPGREALAEAFAEELRRFKQEAAYTAISNRYTGDTKNILNAVEQQESSTAR